VAVERYANLGVVLNGQLRPCRHGLRGGSGHFLRLLPGLEGVTACNPSKPCARTDLDQIASREQIVTKNFRNLDDQVIVPLMTARKRILGFLAGHPTAVGGVTLRVAERADMGRTRTRAPGLRSRRCAARVYRFLH